MAPSTVTDLAEALQLLRELRAEVDICVQHLETLEKGLPVANRAITLLVGVRNGLLKLEIQETLEAQADVLIDVLSGSFLEPTQFTNYLDEIYEKLAAEWQLPADFKEKRKTVDAILAFKRAVDQINALETASVESSVPLDDPIWKRLEDMSEGFLSKLEEASKPGHLGERLKMLPEPFGTFLITTIEPLYEILAAGERARDVAERLSTITNREPIKELQRKLRVIREARRQLAEISGPENLPTRVEGLLAKLSDF